MLRHKSDFAVLVGVDKMIRIEKPDTVIVTPHLNQLIPDLVYFRYLYYDS